MNEITIITFTIGEAGFPPLSHLVDIVSHIGQNTNLIVTFGARELVFDPKRINQYQIKHDGGGNYFSRVLKVLVTQIKICYHIVKNSRDSDALIFFMGGELLILPMLVCKILDKRFLLLLAASHVKMSEINRDYLSILSSRLCKISFALSDYIIIYSMLLMENWNLEDYESKIRVANEHFLDFDKFKIKEDIHKRQDLIGYIGRLSPEKGVMNFVESIPLLAKNRDLKFVVVGDGTLKDGIDAHLKDKNLNNKVELINWVAHEDLPDYLNRLKLIVVPSYTEGLPNIILESMACGTPVLSTPVGAIPDIIEDGYNGFLMEDNSPKSIETNVIRALGDGNLDRIVSNARSFVEMNYNFNTTLSRYKSVFDEFK